MSSEVDPFLAFFCHFRKRTSLFEIRGQQISFWSFGTFEFDVTFFELYLDRFC